MQFVESGGGSMRKLLVSVLLAVSLFVISFSILNFANPTQTLTSSTQGTVFQLDIDPVQFG